MAPYPVTAVFRVIGVDSRILDLPSLLSLPPQEGWEPKIVKNTSDVSLNMAGLIILSDEQDREAVKNKLIAWFELHGELIKSLDANDKWIDVETYILDQAYDGFVFSPPLVDIAARAGCGLGGTTYRLIRDS